MILTVLLSILYITHTMVNTNATSGEIDNINIYADKFLTGEMNVTQLGEIYYMVAFNNEGKQGVILLTLPDNKPQMIWAMHMDLSVWRGFSPPANITLNYMCKPEDSVYDNYVIMVGYNESANKPAILFYNTDFDDPNSVDPYSIHVYYNEDVIQEFQFVSYVGNDYVLAYGVSNNGVLVAYVIDAYDFSNYKRYEVNFTDLGYDSASVSYSFYSNTIDVLLHAKDGYHYAIIRINDDGTVDKYISQAYRYEPINMFSSYNKSFITIMTSNSNATLLVYDSSFNIVYERSLGYKEVMTPFFYDGASIYYDYRTYDFNERIILSQAYPSLGLSNIELFNESISNITDTNVSMRLIGVYGRNNGLGGFIVSPVYVDVGRKNFRLHTIVLIEDFLIGKMHLLDIPYDLYTRIDIINTPYYMKTSSNIPVLYSFATSIPVLVSSDDRYLYTLEYAINSKTAVLEKRNLITGEKISSTQLSFSDNLGDINMFVYNNSIIVSYSIAGSGGSALEQSNPSSNSSHIGILSLSSGLDLSSILANNIAPLINQELTSGILNIDPNTLDIRWSYSISSQTFYAPRVYYDGEYFYSVFDNGNILIVKLDSNGNVVNNNIYNDLPVYSRPEWMIDSSSFSGQCYSNTNYVIPFINATNYQDSIVNYPIVGVDGGLCDYYFSLYEYRYGYPIPFFINSTHYVFVLNEYYTLLDYGSNYLQYLSWVTLQPSYTYPDIEYVVLTDKCFAPILSVNLERNGQPLQVVDAWLDKDNGILIVSYGDFIKFTNGVYVYAYNVSSLLNANGELSPCGQSGAQETTTTTSISPPSGFNYSITVPHVNPPGLLVGNPSLTSVYGLFTMALFVGLFVMFSRIYEWYQALAVSSAINIVLSVMLLGIGYLTFFIILFAVAVAFWKKG